MTTFTVDTPWCHEYTAGTSPCSLTEEEWLELSVAAVLAPIGGALQPDGSEGEWIPAQVRLRELRDAGMTKLCGRIVKSHYPPKLFSICAGCTYINRPAGKVLLFKKFRMNELQLRDVVGTPESLDSTRGNLVLRSASGDVSLQPIGPIYC